LKGKFIYIYLAYLAIVLFLSAACVYVSDNIKNRMATLSVKFDIYKNVYITNVSGDRLTANMYGNIRCFSTGKLKEDVSGYLCDITVRDNKVIQVNKKSDVVTGKVLAVSEDSVDIEGYGVVKLDEDFIMYDKDSEAVNDYNSIVVGYDLQDFIVAEGEVCGAVKNRILQADNIRVIIKTTGYKDIFFDEVQFSADGEITVSYSDGEEKVAPQEIFTLNKESGMFANGRVKLSVSEGEIRFDSITRGVGTPAYGGTIEVAAYDGGLVVVNEVPIEDYLKKVVPSEMPSGFNLEALKCQAVCARSYAYTELANNYYGEYGAHIDDSIQYQVYNNSARSDSTDKAVDETCGQVLSYNGEIVKTYYYSTSCGSTTDVSLWGSTSESYPYFVAECVGKVDNSLLLTDENEFARFIKSSNESDYDYGCNLYRWSMEESVEQISSAFKAATGNDIGMINDIEVCRRVNGGAAIEVRVKGDKGEVTLDSEASIRTAFGNAAIDMNTMTGTARYSRLPSTFCIFEKIIKQDVLDGFRITGGGYGHGIGMSQNAANKMAESMTYAQILEFFYRGTTISLASSYSTS